MPYIKKELRETLECGLVKLSNGICMEIQEDSNQKAGILNYVITSLIDLVYGPLKDTKYKDYNEAIWILE